MDLFSELRLLEVMRRDDVTTQAAESVANGLRYLVHWLPFESDPGYALIQHGLKSLSPESKAALLETGSREGRSYTITKDTPELVSFSSWLGTAREAGRRTTPEFLIFSGTSPGEFTRLIQGGTTSGNAALSSVAFPSERPKGERSEAPRAQPGEFTQLLQSTRQAGEPLAVEPLNSAAENCAAETASPEPGEFTTLLKGLKTPETAEGRRREQPGPAEEARPLGEFTRLTTPTPPAAERGVQRPTSKTLKPYDPFDFTSRPQQTSSPNEARSEGDPSKLGSQREPGEFTRLTTPPNFSERPPAAFQRPIPSAPAPPGEYTRMFRPVAQPGANLPIKDELPPAYQAPVAADTFEEKHVEGPSEYTRLFSVSAQTSSAQTKPPQPPSEAATAQKPEAPKKPEPALWIAAGVLGILAVCAIILIVYFAGKR